MPTANNIIWTEWVKRTEAIRAEAATMSRKELKEKILSFEDIASEKQKKLYLKKLRWLNRKKLTDLWIEKEYHATHPYGI
ncbi:MAG: hypothetical protein IK115_14060 [Lachnospiraceae bacterium]|nr:hypothetical protein [Lachnospiraceae bacterium]